jgi:hypothetical protein
MHEQPPIFYPEHSARQLGQFYVDHVMAMTREKLHEKSDIAIQLAWRDAELRRLREANLELLDSLKHARWRIANLVGPEGAQGIDRTVIDKIDSAVSKHGGAV